MACEVCQHCMAPVPQGEAQLCEGYSYHSECHKCYVCSETELHHAEVFKGVIFCAACARRIFQGCSSARRAKTRRERRAGGRRRRSAGTESGVIERARLARSSARIAADARETSDVSGCRPAQAPEAKPDRPSLVTIKRAGTDGNAIDVTQELFKRLESPFVIDYETPRKSTEPVKSRKSVPRPRSSTTKREMPCSDLRIAELGASTEIASMGLHKHSELAVHNKSESCMRVAKKETTSSVNTLSQVSDVSKEDSNNNLQWLRSERDRHLLNRHLGSIIKIPFKLFKKNIVMRSSLISVIMNSESEKEPFYQRFKMFFREEVVEHQHRGLKRLYSTINRRKTPYKMGWLDSSQFVSKTPRCKHFHASHSYRCMRAQVMRLAGPTKSEMKNFRTKIKKTIVPESLKKIRMRKQKCVDMISAACGSERGALPAKPSVRSI